MGDIQLTSGFLGHVILKKETELALNCRPVIQVLGLKKFNVLDGTDRYRLLISDGEHSYSFAMIGLQLNSLIDEKLIENSSVLRINQMICHIMKNVKIFLILSVDVVARGRDVGCILGNPTLIPHRLRNQQDFQVSNAYTDVSVSSLGDSESFSLSNNGASSSTAHADSKQDFETEFEDMLASFSKM